jgi:amino acid adenylation domain-containing protein
MLEEHAELAPDATAVVYQEQHLCYQELNDRANRLGHYLRSLGVGPEVRVGLCTERSLEMIVGLLGILKAGGCYLPLDPAFPSQRLATILDDAQAPLLLIQERLRDKAPSHWAQVVSLDGMWDTISKYSAANLKSCVAPHNLAYLIYTSGSTGRPKGVCIEHAQLSHYLRAVSEQLKLGVGAKFGLVSSFAADLGNTVLFPALCGGGELHVISEACARDAWALADYFERARIDCIKITPSHLKGLLSGKDTEGLLPDKLLALGGEASDWPWIAELERLKPGCRILNHYGPTECTVGAITYPVTEAEDERTGRSVPLGRPLSNVQAYVVDSECEPLPVGVFGELCLGGSGVGRGYLNQPEATAEKFVADMFSGEAGGRLYRTGDLARWNERGTLEFQGRIDHQIKVRGYRIELGDIEAALSAHEGVRQCAVVVREDQPGDQRLAAYIVVEPKAEMDWQKLRRYLQARLPDYMVPTAFVALESLPLTPSGKLHRQALPIPPRDSLVVDQKLEPRDSTETYLKQIWENVLGVHNISIRDNFLDLGGHSVNAITLCARISKAYGTNVPVRAIYDAPTVEQMAAFLRQEIALSPPSSTIPIQPHGSHRPLFCVHPAGGLVHCYVTLARYLGRDQPLYGIQSRGLDEGQEPITKIELMADLYIQDLRRIQPKGPYQIIGLSMGALVAFEMALQLIAAGEDVSFLGLLDGACHADLLDFYAEGWERSLLEWEQEYIIVNAEIELGIPPDQMRQLEWEEALTHYVEGVKLRDKLPSDITVAQFRRFLRTFATNSRAGRSYRPKPYQGRISLFRTEIAEGDDDTYGWRQFALGGVDVYPLPGQHGNFIAEPNVQLFSKMLKTCII